MNEFILEDAICRLDLELLEWHLKKKNELRNKRKSKIKIFKLSAIAACFCFVIIAGFILMPYINHNSDQFVYHKYLGDTQKSDIAEITFNSLDRENHICYFTLIKKDNTPFYFEFGGYTYDEWIDVQGNKCWKHQAYDIITPYKKYKPEYGHKVLEIDLIITVNGNVVDSIPREPGKYEISIDFSEMYNVLDGVYERVRVSHFEEFIFQTFESIHPDVTRITD